MALSLTGCDDDGVDTDAAAARVGHNPTAEDRYLDALRVDDPYLALEGSWSDQLLLRVGYTNCEALDDDWTVENVMSVMLRSNASEHDTVMIVGAGIDHLCPRNEHKMAEFLEQGAELGG